MGFFSAAFSGIRDGYVDARANLLLNEVISTFETMKNWDERVQTIATLGFLQVRARIIKESVNVSQDGRIKIAKEMQVQAKKSFDLDMGGSCAKWLGGAWLECRERQHNHPKAQEAYYFLEEFAKRIEG